MLILVKKREHSTIKNTYHHKANSILPMKIIKPNRIIAKLILINFSLYASWGFVMPIFAIYVADQINGGTVETLGIAIGIFWATKAFFQPFLAYRIDSIKGEEDDIIYLFTGVIIISVIPLFFILATEIWHVFLLMGAKGLGMAMIVPVVDGVFTRHIKKNWESFMWSLDSTSISLAHASSAMFGGLIAGLFGFEALFVLVSIIGFSTAIIVYFTLKNDLFLSDDRGKETTVI